MKFTGKVTMVLDKSGVSKQDKPFIACQYRLEETEGQYPQSCVIDVFGDRLPTLNVGDIAEVDFNMKCDEYQGKLYGKNNAWRITVITAAASGGNSGTATVNSVESMVPPVLGNIEQVETDDLPFNQGFTVIPQK